MLFRAYPSLARALLALIASTAAAATLSAATPTSVGERQVNPLRIAAGDKLLIGGAASAVDLQNPKLAALVKDEFSALTAHRDMMPALVVDDDGNYTFEAADAVAQFAQEHGIALYGHMLTWQHLSRDWLYKDKEGNPLPREQALANVKGFITTVVQHFRGKIAAWDVVNEAISDEPGEYLRDIPIRRAIGDDFIVKAFQFAHEADPDVRLYYNDYNIELPEKRAKTLRLLRELRAAGCRVDAVGIQGHWMLDSKSPEPHIISDAIREFHDAGFKVMVTELDIDVLPRTVSGANMETVEHGPNPYPERLPDDVQQQLARRYGEIFDAILAPGVVTMITFWGSHDGRSWLNNFPVKRRTNYPLLFDRDLKRKPAYYAVVESLESARKKRE
jgi:endo-1,4-beta-xylanase